MNRWTTPTPSFHTFLLVAQLEPEAIMGRIRQARIEAEFTQQELADLIDRHKRTIENYENTRVPEWKELAKIAKVLDRDVEWFLYGDEARGQLVDEQLAEINRKLDLILSRLGSTAKTAPASAPAELAEGAKSAAERAQERAEESRRREATRRAARQN